MTGAAESMRAAVFLDRDGVLNELVERAGVAVSPRRPEDFRIRPGTVESVLALRELGLAVFVVTNQPDVARGFMDRAALDRMSDLLRAAVPIDDMLICSHDDRDGCACRKPQPGMLLSLAARWQVDLARSYMVGDSWRDVEAGRAAGCRTILVGGGNVPESSPDWIVADLPGAVAAIGEHLQCVNAEPS